VKAEVEISPALDVPFYLPFSSNEILKDYSCSALAGSFLLGN
jgi:hypothetical protein